MRNTYPPDELNSRPNILEVVGRYVSLRRIGREERGLCPLHDDRHPSLRVNQDKQVWYCDPCGTGGDVIRFVELVEGCSFREALATLGMDGQRPPSHSSAVKAVSWARGQIEKINFRLRELDEMIEVADEIPDTELAESLWRERRILGDLRDDLGRFEYRKDFAEIRDVIENITKGFE